MTKTLSLNTRQWRVLLHDNLDVLKAAVASTETLSDEGLRMVLAQLDDMKMLAAAWYQVGVPAAPAAETSDVAHAIEAAPIVKKRGWPKGKKRNAPGMLGGDTQAVQ